MSWLKITLSGSIQMTILSHLSVIFIAFIKVLISYEATDTIGISNYSPKLNYSVAKSGSFPSNKIFKASVASMSCFLQVIR